MNKVLLIDDESSSFEQYKTSNKDLLKLYFIE